MDIISSTIAGDNFIVVNRDLITKLGLNSAVMLCELANERSYYINSGELVGGMFYSTIDNVQKRTGLSRRQQSKAISELKEFGVIEVVVKGVPAKRYFKLNESEILKILANKKCAENQNVQNEHGAPNEHDSLYETDKLAGSKCAGKNNKKNNKKNNNNNTKKERKKKESKKTTNYDSIINESIQDESVKKEIYEFIKMRKLIKKPMTDRALKGLISKLNELSSNPVDQAKILERSVINDWQSVYPLPSNNNGYRNNNGYQGNTEVKRDGSDYAEFDY